MTNHSYQEYTCLLPCSQLKESQAQLPPIARIDASRTNYLGIYGFLNFYKLRESKYLALVLQPLNIFKRKSCKETLKTVKLLKFSKMFHLQHFVFNSHPKFEIFLTVRHQQAGYILSSYYRKKVKVNTSMIPTE